MKYAEYVRLKAKIDYDYSMELAALELIYKRYGEPDDGKGVA